MLTMEVNYINFTSNNMHVCIVDYCIISFIMYIDVADGVNTPSPVRSIDVNKIPPTPTKTVAAPSFQNLTNGNLYT